MRYVGCSKHGDSGDNEHKVLTGVIGLKFYLTYAL